MAFSYSPEFADSYWEEFFFLPEQNEEFVVLEYLAKGDPPLLPIFKVSPSRYRDQIIKNSQYIGRRPPLLGYDYIHKCPILTIGLTWATGIYAIYNRDKEKIWIGSSIQIRGRWVSHLCGCQWIAREKRNELQQDLFSNPSSFFFCAVEILQRYDASTRSFRWYGGSPYSTEDLRQREQFWLDLIPKEHSYNVNRAVGLRRRRSTN
uniref:Excinuclease ABC C subunit domain protein n=1 Tax=Cyanothece sp. (strain PCC 7425 / ATCC 29141) TaxID=395961 RepID=B8HWJ7_CYAP4